MHNITNGNGRQNGHNGHHQLTPEQIKDDSDLADRIFGGPERDTNAEIERTISILGEPTPKLVHELWREVQAAGRRERDLEDREWRVTQRERKLEALEAENASLKAELAEERARAEEWLRDPDSVAAQQIALARAETRALANGSLGRSALTLVAIINLYWQNADYRRAQGLPEDRGWVTVWNVQVAEAIGAKGRNRSDHIRAAGDLGEELGLFECRTLQTGLGKGKVKRERQYKVTEGYRLSELYGIIADYRGDGEHRGGRRQPNPNSPKCPTCKRTLGPGHKH